MKYNRLLLFFVLVVNSTNTFAQWPALSVPNVAVTSLGAATKAQKYWAASDNVGGSYTVWEDDRNNPGGKTDVFCQRIDKRGFVKFIANGVGIGVIAGSNQKRPLVAKGSNSTALICWEDERNTGALRDDIYAQKIDSNGVIQWTANGVLVCNATDKQQKPWIVSDGSGGAIIAWEDKRTGTEDIYAQRIDATGNPLWTINGVAICSAADKQKRIHMIADGNGGAIITWEDERNKNTDLGFGKLNKDIYAQKINAAGLVQWTVNGVSVSSKQDDQKKPQLATDGLGGAIITWEDKRTGVRDIYAQRINSTGSVKWSIDGVIVCNAIDKQKEPTIASEGLNGAVIAWEDKRTGTADIYAQRVDSVGIVQWLANGVAVCNATGRQKRVFASTGNFSTVLLTWEDNRTGTEDIYVEIVASNGVMKSGTVNGVLVCSDLNTQKKPFIFRSGTYDWIVLWEDDRINPGVVTDIYAQGLNPSILIALPVELLSFNAIKRDKTVELTWTTISENNNAFFTIERSNDAISWDEIFITKGAGYSNNNINYLEVDVTPLNGLSYYRLKQTDFDGKYSYRNIIPINFKQENSPVVVFPNPNNGTYFNMNLQRFSNKEVLVVVRDITGKQLYTKLYLVEKNQNIKIVFENKLPKGTYIVVASSSNDLVSKKLIVK